ncbi:MAG: AraC family transcriptional regulator [Thermomicrobiales bacterium]|nr:AraC family transcriptional regulator [Thermomicrobiales bacterium]
MSTSMLQPVDPLGEALYYLRMTGLFYSRCAFTAPWGLDLPAMPGFVLFHAVTHGSCWLDLGDGDEVQLRAGDVVLVPHGAGHRMTNHPSSRAISLWDTPRTAVSERYDLLQIDGGGERTDLICGAVRFEHAAAANLIGVLPKVLRIESGASAQGEWVQSTLRYMATEARTLRLGGEAVITRLSDVLVIQAIRSWLEESDAARGGWLGALRDEKIGRALTAIHRDPAREWSVAILADEVAMSRSAFAARFTELVGQPAMTYVTWWRMQVALGLLREEGITAAEAAGRIGYNSEAAFSRAFKRTLGFSPGAARAQVPEPVLPAWTT